MKSVYLLEPLPWHLAHLCSGGFPWLLPHMEVGTNTCTCSQCKVCCGHYHFNSGSLPVHLESLGRGINHQPVATRTLQNKSEVRIANCLFPSAQEPSQVKDIWSIFTFVYGWITQNTILPIISTDLWTWLYLANSTNVHYQLPTFLFCSPKLLSTLSLKKPEAVHEKWEVTDSVIFAESR